MDINSFLEYFKQQPDNKYPKSRYERKFTTETMPRFQVQNAIRLNPGMFREIYSERFINNIYLDTFDLAFYYENIVGSTSRIKARIRWYGDPRGYIKKPVLEFKIKQGLAGNKVSYPLVPFLLDYQFTSDTLRDVFQQSDLPEWTTNFLANLEPQLINRYKRKYYLSSDSHYRCTLDSDLSYTHISRRNNSLLKYSADETLLIIELKYDIPFDDAAWVICNAFPFRLTKSSKYVNGIDSFRYNQAI